MQIAQGPHRRRAWRAAAISLGGHVLIVASVFLGLRQVTPNDPAPDQAMAIQILPTASAPPAPPHETPPQVQRPVPQPRHEQQKEILPDAPRIAAVKPVTLPPRQEQAPSPSQPPPPPPPSAPPQPVRAPSAAPVQGAPTPGVQSAEQNWEGQVMAKLERKKRYPGEAMRAGQEDVVYLHVVVDRTGRVLQSDIAKSKHFTALDDATRDLIKRVNPLPPLPGSVTGDTYSFTVPIDFFIERAAR